MAFLLPFTAITGMPCSSAAKVGRPMQPSGITRQGDVRIRNDAAMSEETRIGNNRGRA